MRDIENMVASGARTATRIVIGAIVLILMLVGIGSILEDDEERGIGRLLDAIMAVESGGDPNAIGDRGTAKGAFQLSRVYVEDVERIVGGDMRYSPLISRAYVAVYLKHYATKERLGYTPTWEDLARIHNGGPDGYFKPETEAYWLKVKEALDR